MNGVIAIIQARMGSTRLPGKVLLDLAGEPMLARVVDRVRRAGRIDDIVVATTVSGEDDRIVSLCRERGWRWFRGEVDDVLDRYFRAATEARAGIVVRITSDCPLIDPVVVDRVVEEFAKGRESTDYASNIFPLRTFPRGLDTEAIGYGALERSWREEREMRYREHVTQYILRHPQLFRIRSVTNDTDLSGHRWTVDTPGDLAFVRAIYDHFGHDRFSTGEILAFLAAHPEVVEMNRGVVQKQV
jgi:spore coat polysaccharide biosynthesis protein SpsF